MAWDSPLNLPAAPPPAAGAAGAGAGATEGCRPPRPPPLLPRTTWYQCLIPSTLGTFASPSIHGLPSFSFTFFSMAMAGQSPRPQRASRSMSPSSPHRRGKLSSAGRRRILYSSPRATRRGPHPTLASPQRSQARPSSPTPHPVSSWSCPLLRTVRSISPSPHPP